ncbi:serine/threonine protein kinase [Janibacter sp. YIM B02568]|uniref:serine/threonine-protein kinase n=1 Tax=Janibacter endophyticus TaxID=2806261 RepID=UPI00194E90D0|nr:serine/threonine-protein kinase [Janibacter endophyticus]MBM6545289.1 serine/threonine protein kinase [Janibacter endophyticus]
MTTELIGGDPLPEEPVARDASSEEAPVVHDFDRIGPYRVVQQLGQGGMGVVHLALDQRGRAVALKVLRPHVAHDADARARLGREVATLARVRSPRVAPVFDADLDGDQPYIVTRYVPGPSLDSHVKEHGPLPADELLRLGRGLAEALRSIHEIGVIHRDLKPGNVLLVDGDPVLIDFGIAHDADSSRMTMTGLVMGTPGYLSPEIVEGAEVDAATDWWGWAATLVFAASGHPPFGRGGMEAVLSRVMRGDVDLTGVDERLAPLLYAALTPDAARRPHADEVLRALERYAEGRPVTEALPVRSRAMPAAAATTHLPSPNPPTAVLPAVAPSWPADSPGRHQPAPHAPQPAPQAWVDPFAGYQHEPRQEVVPAPSAWPGSVPSEREGDPRIGRPRRTDVLLGLLAAIVGGAAIAPLLTLVLVLIGCVLARTVDQSMTATVMRRYTHGRRRSDAAVATAKSPLHLIGAALTTLFALVLPVLVGLSAVIVAGLVVSQASAGESTFDHPAALAVGGLVTTLTAWWGPGSPSLRRGTRSLVRGVTGVAPIRVGLTVLLAVAGLLLLGAALSAGAPATWWPLVDSPVPDTPWIPSR